MASALSFSLLILLSSLSLASSQYVLPQRYFINCGSNSDVDFTNRNFVGDGNPSTFSISGDHQAAENNNPVTDTIYRTARVFTKKSSYNLEADQNNTFVMIRLHFSRFSTRGFEFSNSKVDVSVAGFPLLSGFSIGNATVIREFIFPIHAERKFSIEFTPTAGSSSAVFVNAIEAFTTPADLFTTGVSFPRISPAGKIGNFDKLTEEYAFNPIHRVNVGGERINIDRDTLRRTWTGDEPFIFSNGPATNVSLGSGGQINHREDGASSSDAPDDVYRTAKRLNNTSVNITWTFDVEKETIYLVRAHFCDIVSTGLVSPADAFNFFVYSHFKEEIQPGNRMRALSAPFYVDLVVESTDSNKLNVSIGAIRGNNQPVLLNGIEIMELLKNSGVSGPEKKGKSVYVVVGCVVGGLAFVIVLLLAGFFIGKRCGKQKKVVGGGKSGSHNNVVQSHGRSSYTNINIDPSVNHPSTKLDLNLKVPYVDIVQATNNFDENLVLGRGGFGKVYKGTLNGVTVAIKQGEYGKDQGWAEFVNEITVLSKIRFRDLVCLIGYCDENSEMLLVYEFMEKGTLQEHLYGDADHPKLTWERRLQICISAARGLNYLHTGAEAGIIHRDVKSTNILLNENYDAKVADFGISRLDDGDVSDMSHVKGSFGYLDPEYVRCNRLTQKSDVYSFGVVLLEVLCAKPALDTTQSVNVNLADWASKHIKNDNVEAIIDPVLAGTIHSDSLRNFVETVERCLKETGDERPCMNDVLWDLEYVLRLQQNKVGPDAYDDTTNMSLVLPTSILHRLPLPFNDDSYVTDTSISSYPSESQVFSQLKIDEAR